MQEPNTLRIVLVGKQGSGKSSLANCILGEAVFNVSHGSDAKIRRSKARTKDLNGRRLTVVDTPGALAVDSVDRERQCEWMSCWAQCAPGPHAVLLVMPVERFTQQERAVVERMKTEFGPEVLRFTTVVFTHGDQLPENMRISEFVEQSAALAELVRACGGRCHVVDRKYWTNETPEGDPQRSNAFQVDAILASVEKTARENQTYFSNYALERVEREIQTEQGRLLRVQAGLSLEESREQAKNLVLEKYIEEATRRPPYLKYAVVVVAGIVGVVAAVFVVRKVMKWFAEKPPMPDLTPGPIEGVQEVVQEGVQEVVKEGVQEVVKEGVQEVVKEGVQEVMKEGVQEVMKEVVKEGVQEVVQEGVQELMKEGVQEVVQEGVQEVVKEGVQEVVKEGVQEVVKEGVQEVMKEVMMEGVQEVMMEGVQEVVKERVSILTPPEDLGYVKYDPHNLFE